MKKITATVNEDEEKIKKLETENIRHEKALNIILKNFNRKHHFQKEMINNDIYSNITNSYSHYYSQYQQLKQKFTKENNKLQLMHISYGYSQVEISVQKNYVNNLLAPKNEMLSKVLLAKEKDFLENELKKTAKEKQQKINEENKLYNSNILKIEAKYK